MGILQQECEDFRVDFMDGFSYVVPCEFAFCEKNIWEISSWPLRLCGSIEARAGAGVGFLRDRGAPSAFGAGSLRSGGCVRF